MKLSLHPGSKSVVDRLVKLNQHSATLQFILRDLYSYWKSHYEKRAHCRVVRGECTATPAWCVSFVGRAWNTWEQGQGLASAIASTHQGSPAGCALAGLEKPLVGSKKWLGCMYTRGISCRAKSELLSRSIARRRISRNSWNREWGHHKNATDQGWCSCRAGRTC